MATLSASRRNSTNNSQPTTPRPSITNNNQLLPPQMCSLNEEDSDGEQDHKNNLKHEETVEINASNSNLQLEKNENTETLNDAKFNTNLLQENETEESEILIKNQILEDKIIREVQFDEKNIGNEHKACSERSDSGFSDCSVPNVSTTTAMAVPVFNLINEEESEQKPINVLSKNEQKPISLLSRNESETETPTKTKTNKDNISFGLNIGSCSTKITNCIDKFDSKSNNNQMNKNRKLLEN